MQKKKFYVLCVTVILALFLCSCGAEIASDTIVEDKEFYIDHYDISLIVPQEWEEKEHSNFDIQLTDGKSYVSVMAYYTIDLSQGSTAESTYEWHNEDLFSRRTNVEIIEPMEIIDTDDKKISATLYSAEKDGAKNYYYSCLVQFDEQEDVFAWVLVSALPSYMTKQQDDFMEIIKTMKYSPQKSDISQET